MPPSAFLARAEFFYAALRPWVHYVPTGYNGRAEVSTIVQARRLAPGEWRRGGWHGMGSEGMVRRLPLAFEYLPFP